MTITSPETQPSVEEPPTTDRRKLALLGGVAVLALAGAGYFFLGGSGGSTDEGLGVVPHHVTKPIVKVAAKPVSVAGKGTKPVVKLPPVSTAVLGRDPFHPLYVLPVAAPAAVQVTTPTATSPTAPPATGTTGSTTGGTTGGTTATATPAPTRYRITLLSVKSTGTRTFTFRIGSVTKVVVTAQRFGKYGELVVLGTIKNSRGTVTGALLQVGDADPVTIHLGERLTVQ
jgi:hypothetical protein